MNYLIEKYLGEAAPKAANLKFGDQVEQNSKARKGTGKAKIDASIYTWANKKFGGKGEYSITNQSTAIQSQEIKINKAKGSMGSSQIIIKPFGDYIMVMNDKGGGMMNKASKKFFKV